MDRGKSDGIKWRENIKIILFFSKYIHTEYRTFQNKFVCDSKIIISCGRKSVIPSIYLKNKFKMKLSTLNGIKIYDLSQGKSLPEYMEEAKKRNIKLKTLDEFRNRIELI